VSDCQHQFAFGPFFLNPATHDLVRDGQPIALTPKAFDVLLVLVESRGRLIEKGELIRMVWPDTFVEEGNLYVTISLLRKIFGEHEYIQTVPKHGYRFVADVNLLSAAPARLDVPATIPLSELQPSARKSTNGILRMMPRFPRIAAVASGALLLTGLIAAGLLMRVARSHHANAPNDVKSLAVLPFSTLDSEADNEFLGLGMADALITKLASTGRIATRPVRAIQKYQNTSQDPRSIGQELGVDAVLDGSIQRSGDRVRVTAQLIRVGDGIQLWSETFDEQYTDMFAVEDTVSAQVATSIRLPLTEEEKERLAQRPTTNNEAYESYLRGRYFWNERTGEGLRRGLDYFRHAIELDPSFAKAYAGIADSYAMLGLYTVLPPNEAFPRAKAAAIEALQMDSSLAEAHATLGFAHFYYDWDGAAADKEFLTALQEDPNYAMAHSWRGFNLAVMGRMPEAMTEANLAQSSDPLSAIVGTNAAWVYCLAHQNDQAIQILKRVIEIDPNFPRAHFRLGNIYEDEGQYRHAISEYEKAVQLSNGDTYYQASLGHAYAMAGMTAEADKSLRRLELLSGERYVPAYGIALIYLGMGHKDDSFKWLQRASEDRSTSLVYMRVDPTLDSLRSDKRFPVLVQKTNF
jgi:DNA-binding winged helix-turn-helix (wHTH) protein/TolB-like protein/tetratricopeptide (TPR) repeat protein